MGDGKEWEALQRRLWQLVGETGLRLADGAKGVAGKLFGQLRAEGFTLTPEIEKTLGDYLDTARAEIHGGIGQAVRLGSLEPMRDALVARLAAQAFDEQWPDGLTLSKRLWKFNNDTTRGFEQVLRNGINAGKAANALVYDLQREVEARGARFQVVHQELDDWASLLAEKGQALVRDPATRKSWDRMVADVRAHLEGLAGTSTRHAAQTAFKAIQKAVAQGSEETIGQALYWWFYDKQLFLLRRIARTELATAQHRAVIASTEADDDVIGYQWRLSSSHPRPDICDWYASIDMGLGKGVWSKDAVPRHKAHPHCMCTITPRVTKVKAQGATSYADFISQVTPERRGQLLPKWAQDAVKAGTPLEKLIRPDGLGLVSKADAAKLLPA